jgi:stage III sporulation protein SpoIIIAA
MCRRCVASCRCIAQPYNRYSTRRCFSSCSSIEPRRYAGARASLSDVLRACDLPVNEQKKQFQAAFNEAFWREPQLSSDKLRYAADDVRYLVQLRDIMLRRLSLGVASWSARYAAYFEEHEADIDGANNGGDAFGALCRLTFTEPMPPSHMPRAVATLVATADDNDAQGDIGMPPASLLTNMEFEPEFDRLLDVLPPTLAERLRERHDLAILRHSLAELIVDAGFAVDLYHRDGRRERLHDCVVGKDELNALVGEWRDANMVGIDNRVTIEDSLHRISVKIDRLGDVDGLTCRVGKHMPGAAALLRDVVARVARKGASLLLLGPPGSGKTTLLREVAKELADEYDKRVNVVDTSNEIAGDGERKHPAIGSARRTAVPFDLRSSRHDSSDAQAIVMREVIANHTPEVLVVDELCTKAQAAAAASCGQRGVALVATAHGRELVELRRNAELNRLLGGFESFPVSDAEQARLGAASKAVPSRLGLPVFDIVVELRKVGEYVVHMDATDSVDALLAQPGSETPAATVSHRWCSAANGAMWVRFEEFGGSAALLRRRNRRPRRAGGERRADRGWLSALQEEGQQK